jgi:hypothetical protein
MQIDLVGTQVVIDRIHQAHKRQNQANGPAPLSAKRGSHFASPQFRAHTATEAPGRDNWRSFGEG